MNRITILLLPFFVGCVASEDVTDETVTEDTQAATTCVGATLQSIDAQKPLGGPGTVTSFTSHLPLGYNAASDPCQPNRFVIEADNPTGRSTTAYAIYAGPWLTQSQCTSSLLLAQAYQRRTTEGQAFWTTAGDLVLVAGIWTSTHGCILHTNLPPIPAGSIGVAIAAEAITSGGIADITSYLY